ncbi:hypothetical protein Ancab_018468 [Ancistrocladus abbreviatus]
MQSTNSLRTSSFLPCSPFFIKSKPTCKVTTRIMAMRREPYEHHDFDYNGRLVDENMIVLRMRIQEMKMIERNYEAPSDWMAWEKQWYAKYGSFVCEVTGMLQSQLMNTRPSLALGMMALITLSVPTSAVLILFQLLSCLRSS